MSRPKKPAKTAKNRPPEFQEATVAALPGQLSFGYDASRSRPHHVAAWVIAAILVGVVAGRIVSNTDFTSVLAPAPNRIALPSLSVAQSFPGVQLSSALPVTSPVLAVAPPNAFPVVEAGAPYATMSASGVQPAAGQGAFRSSQSYQKSLQGTVGTAPVR